MTNRFRVNGVRKTFGKPRCACVEYKLRVWPMAMLIAMLAGCCASTQANTISNLCITEIMYDPATDEPRGEWVEIYNAAISPVDISGQQLSDLTGSSRQSYSKQRPTLARSAHTTVRRERKLGGRMSRPPRFE